MKKFEMKVDKFHNFILENNKRLVLNEEEEDKVGFGGGGSGSYVASFIESLASINKMLSFLQPADPDLVSKYVSKKNLLSESLQPTLNSHGSLWKGLDTMAADLELDVKSSKMWQEKEIDQDKTSGKVEDLFQKYKDGEITGEQVLRSLKRQEFGTTTQGVKNVYFEKSRQGFKFLRQAIRAFAQCAVGILKAEKGKAPDWLEGATTIIQKNLTKK